MLLIKMHSLGRFLYTRKLNVLSRFIFLLQRFLFNSVVPHSVNIGENTKFAYGGISVVIHSRAVIGKRVVIGQCVTIGGRNKMYNVPIIEDDVFIGAGARILGDVVIGSGSIIAPNAVVTKSVPSNTIMAGIPARATKSNIDINEYI
ncbi:Serine acetyltransferase [Vibrio chagasii]|nr:Serine acetyltransferase [Vibrio chagasii]